MFRITESGVTNAAGMKHRKLAVPTFEGVLSAEEVAAVLSRLKAQRPPWMRERHAPINADHGRLSRSGVVIVQATR